MCMAGQGRQIFKCKTNRRGVNLIWGAVLHMSILVLHAYFFSKVWNAPAWPQLRTTAVSREDLRWDRKLKRKQYSLRSARDSPGEGEVLGTSVFAVSSNYSTPCAESPLKPTLEDPGIYFYWDRKLFFFFPYQKHSLCVNPGLTPKTHILHGCFTTLPPK